MSNGDLSFNVGSEIKVEGIPFVVEGYITFKQNDGSSWTEYRIRSRENYEVKWLSVDTQYDEYAVYTECGFNKEFLTENIVDKGYKMVEDESAKVIDYEGNVDVDMGEVVVYREYEDSTEELLLSIEQWDGGKGYYIEEYSKGYYIEKNSIEKTGNSNMYKHVGSTIGSLLISKCLKIFCIIGFMALILILMKSCPMGLDNAMSNFINSDINFVYATSITSDLDQNKKADVYLTTNTVEDTAKLIIDGLNGNIADVQENQEDGSVVITTRDELALIYTSEDNQTLIQISTREYVYSSRNIPYRSRRITGSFYRSYYFGSLYQKDMNRFSKSPDGYGDFKGEGFTLDDNNKYKVYSSSVRQSSTSSRSSSGGGTSFGK